ncbi:MAG TPA: hypothetical protein VLA43_07175, partial [Longimicrobiales bacterium]|nr:hypothetical protein [Longimicrobiales bacterium]
MSIPISQLEAGALMDRRFILGGEAAPFVLSGDTAIAVAIPLFLGESGWSEPPSEPVRLELWAGDSLVAVSREPLHVTPLPQADGSLESLAES